MNQEKMKNMAESCCSEQMASGCPCSSMIEGHKTGFVLFAAVSYLFLRRVAIPQLRYISLSSDYFPLFLIFGLCATGIAMRYFWKVDIATVKIFVMSLLHFAPDTAALAKIGSIFYVHMFFLVVLLMYFPFSKLMHAAGVFFSPTRNMANDSRMKLHVNPWNPEKVYRTYEAYEDEFRVPMVEAGLPVVKQPEE